MARATGAEIGNVPAAGCDQCGHHQPRSVSAVECHEEQPVEVQLNPCSQQTTRTRTYESSHARERCCHALSRFSRSHSRFTKPSPRLPVPQQGAAATCRDRKTGTAGCPLAPAGPTAERTSVDPMTTYHVPARRPGIAGCEGQKSAHFRAGSGSVCLSRTA